MDRRRFIQALGQKSLLAILLFVSGALLLKRNGKNSCKYDFACSNCKSLKACNFPEALAFKKRNNLYNSTKKEISNGR